MNACRLTHDDQDSYQMLSCNLQEFLCNVSNHSHSQGIISESESLDAIEFLIKVERL